MEDMAERECEIFAVLEQAKKSRPTFYDMVCETPSMITVKSLLRGITDNNDLILLVTGYLSTKIKS